MVDNDCRASAGNPAPAPPAQPETKHWPRSDVVAIVSAAIAALSVIISLCIAHDARLDAQRDAIRAQALSFINFNQRMLNDYNCYFVALPDAKNIGDNKKEAQEDQKDIDKAKQGLAKIGTWGNADLDKFRRTLDALPGEDAGTNTELVGKLRSKLTPAQIARADQVCMFGG